MLDVAPAIFPAPGISWIEFLLMFESYGGTPGCKSDDKQLHIASTSTKQRIAIFRKRVTYVVKHFVQEHDKELFRACAQ